MQNKNPMTVVYRNEMRERPMTVVYRNEQQPMTVVYSIECVQRERERVKKVRRRKWSRSP